MPPFNFYNVSWVICFVSRGGNICGKAVSIRTLFEKVPTKNFRNKWVWRLKYEDIVALWVGGAPNWVLSRIKLPLYWLEAVSCSKEKSKRLYFLFFFSLSKTGYRWAISPCLPASLPVSPPLLSPCSALRSTGELYLICDRIILLFSLHLVHTRDIALEWENYWLVVGYVHVCLCMCVCVKRRDVTPYALCDTVCWKLMRKNVSQSAACTVHAPPPCSLCVFFFAYTDSAVLRRSSM